MALNIKNDRVHELAREAAARTGMTQTSALEMALEQYLAGLTAAPDPSAGRLDRARELVGQIQAGLTEEDREAMRDHLSKMYDEDGLPA